jgi:integrase
MRIGEILALRWNDILRDRIVVDERLWEGDLDVPKSIIGMREIPFDRRGVVQEAVTRMWMTTKHRKPEDFVFATRNGTPLQRRNVLRRVKIAAKALGLPKQIDFRSFRTMHSSLMGRAGRGRKSSVTTWVILKSTRVGISMARAGGKNASMPSLRP